MPSKCSIELVYKYMRNDSSVNVSLIRKGCEPANESGCSNDNRELLKAMNDSVSFVLWESLFGFGVDDDWRQRVVT